jgi:hypothetical protein
MLPGPGSYEPLGTLASPIRGYIVVPECFDSGDDAIGYHDGSPATAGVPAAGHWDYEAAVVAGTVPGEDLLARNRALRGLYASRTCVTVRGATFGGEPVAAHGSAKGDEAAFGRQVQVRHWGTRIAEAIFPNAPSSSRLQVALVHGHDASLTHAHGPLYLLRKCSVLKAYVGAPGPTLPVTRHSCHRLSLFSL